MTTRVFQSKSTLSLATNAGTMETHEKAEMSNSLGLPDYGHTWFDEDAMTNVLSLANMVKKYRVTFDSWEENAFIVHVPQGPLKFSITEDNLYALNPDLGPRKDELQATKYHFIQSVRDNKRFYTKRQLARAALARNLLHSLGHPTTRDLKAVLRINTIRNCPVTERDLEIMERVYGPDPATVKGKTTRRKPAPVVSDNIKIPRELVKAQQEVELCIDTMFINGMPYLTSISKRIMYRTAQWVPSREMQDYRSVLENILRIYKRAGLPVKTIFSHNEFCPLLDPMRASHGFDTNYAAPQEHVPEAERNNRVIQERV